MRLDFWNKRDCECAQFKVTVTVDEPKVCRMSPARLLANSLTDPETRGEWIVEPRNTSSGIGVSTRYHNASRDITITRWFSGFSAGIITPFTLSEAEEKAVRAALTAFDRRKSEEAEAKALSRLTAPREGLKPDRGETPKSGSTAKRRKPGPKGRAQ